MVQRLLIVAHAATQGVHDLVFTDQSELAHPDLVEPIADRVASWSCGPELACLQTARLLGGEPEVITAFAALDAGSWTGRTVQDVAAADPEGLSRWLSDPCARPHGGESLEQLIGRVAHCCDSREWRDGRNVLVVAPLVGRALAVHALGAAPGVIFRIDLAPLHRVGLSRSGTGWRLQRLGT
jgi:broad specificity phosphatase PhoE